MKSTKHVGVRRQTVRDSTGMVYRRYYTLKIETRNNLPCLVGDFSDGQDHVTSWKTRHRHVPAGRVDPFEDSTSLKI